MAKLLLDSTNGGTLANIAILIGNTEYQTLSKLDCCGEDVLAVKELLDATGKFESIEPILNSDCSQLKQRIRATIDAHESIAEIFFYFTGHGFQHEAEFFFCATNFDAKRPNETGLSNSELHMLLRSPEAALVVKVIDACSSGALLVKSDGSFLTTNKQGFKNLIQIASCLDSQNSLTGKPLSPFTDKFRTAALRKTEGIVYYTDIIDTLRDEFLDNNYQTPHFVSQGTGREQFIENANRLDELRAKLSSPTPNTGDSSNVPSVIETLSSALDILERAEKKFARKELAQEFISHLFDKLSDKASNDGSLGQFFKSELVVHSNFQEPAAQSFIIRVLSGEKRPDNFVTTTSPFKNRRLDPLGFNSLATMLLDPDDAVAGYSLHLNCELDKAQLKITFTPKFVTLKRFVLVVSCAPSLECCYVMEMLMQHSLRDWGVFDADGVEVVRRWYKLSWTDSCEYLAEKICGKLKDIAQESIDAAAKALSA
jgi:hypothetical protein